MHMTPDWALEFYDEVDSLDEHDRERYRDWVNSKMDVDFEKVMNDSLCAAKMRGVPFLKTYFQALAAHNPVLDDPMVKKGFRNLHRYFDFAVPENGMPHHFYSHSLFEDIYENPIRIGQVTTAVHYECNFIGAFKVKLDAPDFDERVVKSLRALIRAWRKEYDLWVVSRLFDYEAPKVENAILSAFEATMLAFMKERLWHGRFEDAGLIDAYIREKQDGDEIWILVNPENMAHLPEFERVWSMEMDATHAVNHVWDNANLIKKYEKDFLKMNQLIRENEFPVKTE